MPLLKILLDWRFWVVLIFVVIQAVVMYGVEQFGETRIQVKWDKANILVDAEKDRILEKHRQQEQAWNNQIEKERQNATQREAQLRHDADVADAASDGLREQTADLARRLAGSTGETATNAAVAIGELLGDCSKKYSELAATCDRHVDDLKTLIGSWPVNPPKKDKP